MIDSDDFMLFIVITGFVLCGAYFRAQYKDWRRQQTSDAKEKIQVRLLYHSTRNHRVHKEALVCEQSTRTGV